jgi:hypothetical protein
MNRFTIAVFFFLCSSGSFADPLPANVTNGCGTAGWGAIVPDKTLFTRCRLAEACDRHDVCYGRCLPGGDLNGQQATCTDQAAKDARRAVCDSNLYTDIAATNNDRPVCKAYGVLYRWAVKRFGKDHFHGVSGTGQKIDTINAFFAYVDSHPTVFKPEDLEAAFAALEAMPDQKDYRIDFIPHKRRLTIFAVLPDGHLRVELDIQGAKP